MITRTTAAGLALLALGVSGLHLDKPSTDNISQLSQSQASQSLSWKKNQDGKWYWDGPTGINETEWGTTTIDGLDIIMLNNYVNE